MAPVRPSTAPAKPARHVPSSTGKMRSEQRRGDTPAPALPSGRIKVRATQMCFYDLKRRREGDVFVITGPSEFSERYMEVVQGSVPLKSTSPQAALNREHDEILGGTAARPSNLNTDDDDVE